MLGLIANANDETHADVSDGACSLCYEVSPFSFYGVKFSPAFNQLKQGRIKLFKFFSDYCRVTNISI